MASGAVVPNVQRRRACATDDRRFIERLSKLATLANPRVPLRPSAYRYEKRACQISARETCMSRILYRRVYLYRKRRKIYKPFANVRVTSISISETTLLTRRLYHGRPC